MSNLIETAALIGVAIAIYAMRHRILAALQRFDANNIARRRQEQRDRHDQLAHYRHTMRLAEEQVEKVQEISALDERTASPVTRYVFEGVTYATREEAEKVRQESMLTKARDFYVELPAALARRGNGKLGN
jgi:hypothetical protein